MKTFCAFLMIVSYLGASAQIWRVNSNPEIDAHFQSLQEAIDHWEVSDGDTLYLENGSHFGNINLDKQLVIIGPGYFLAENESTYAYPMPVLIQSIDIRADAAGSKLSGIKVIGIVRVYDHNSNDITIERSHLGGVSNWLSSAPSGLTVRNCYIVGDISSTAIQSSNIYNNIVIGRVRLTKTDGSHNIYNNIIYYDNTNTQYALAARNSMVYNNIIIREPVPMPDSRKDYCIDFESTDNANSSFYNNIMTQVPTDLFPDNMFDQVKEDIFLLTGTSDKMWMLKENSPAIGYGTNGDDCGAYGGVMPYIPSGFPFLVPRIFEATIPSSGSGDVIPVHLKIKTQEE